MPLALLALLASAPSAQAFCGFYVSEAETTLTNEATQVVLMREGDRTVLSIQNDYQGPAQDFALVVPVPAVLSPEDVRTLPHEVFARVDTLAAPRLVEYWEQDPCATAASGVMLSMLANAAGTGQAQLDEGPSDADLGVSVEAAFAVGEYDVVILGAQDSAGLEAWLRKERYKIPAGASEVLRPYVQGGAKFLVAKVDIQRALYRGGRAVLSPLRLSYQTPNFALPVRLGLLNARGPQDLIVHVLAPQQRYEVANYENAMLPTNRVVSDAALQAFPEVYEGMFLEATQGRPRVAVTEYAWQATSCDPCPTNPLAPEDVVTLGGDVLGRSSATGLVLTRLHMRYSAEDLGDDLIFKAAPPITGGRGTPDPQGQLDPSVRVAGSDTYQARYVVLHPWPGAPSCRRPKRGQWGARPGGFTPDPILATSPLTNFGLSGGGGPLPMPGDELGEGAWEGSFEGAVPPATPRRQGAPGRCATGSEAGGWASLLLGLLALGGRRRGGGASSRRLR